MAERNQNRTCGPLEEDMTAAIMMIMTNLPGGGCTDPFSVFTFLAFALAVMDLVMEMNRCLYIVLIHSFDRQKCPRKRKRRDTDSFSCLAQTPEEELEEVVDFLLYTTHIGETEANTDDRETPQPMIELIALLLLFKSISFLPLINRNHNHLLNGCLYSSIALMGNSEQLYICDIYD